MGAPLTLAETAAALAARQVSAVELAEAAFARIERLNPVLHAFIRTTPERALAEAKAADARRAAGAGRGALDGVPIAHKDIFETAGIPTTGHSKLLVDHVPTADGTVVRRLAQAGAVTLGKLATHEFAFGGPSFDLPWPPARNPWNPDHFTSGSSSGTAAAVAAGLIVGGTGSDTGGSIRGPAAFCGVSGIKPTYGRVSRAGVLPLAFSLDHAGPLAWTARCCSWRGPATTPPTRPRRTVRCRIMRPGSTCPSVACGSGWCGISTRPTRRSMRRCRRRSMRRWPRIAASGRSFAR